MCLCSCRLTGHGNLVLPISEQGNKGLDLQVSDLHYLALQFKTWIFSKALGSHSNIFDTSMLHMIMVRLCLQPTIPRNLNASCYLQDSKASAQTVLSNCSSFWVRSWVLSSLLRGSDWGDSSCCLAMYHMVIPKEEVSCRDGNWPRHCSEGYHGKSEKIPTNIWYIDFPLHLTSVHSMVRDPLCI